MTHASHFDGDTLTLTSPRGTLVLSQGQCASIVIMAEKYGPVGRVREAHQPAEVCKLCGGTYEECQHKRCYGFVNGDRKPAAQGDEDKLRAWSIGYEYYYDAYFGPDAPFGNQQPTAATLAEVLQAGARLVPLVIMAKDAEIASLREQLAELTRENADQRSTIEEEQINARSLVAERDRALDELAAEREKLSEATKNLHKWIDEHRKVAAELANANACLETSKGEAHRLFEENKTLRNDLAAMTERAEKAEADLAAERLKPKQHHNECLFCGTRFSAMYDKCPVCAARAEAERWKERAEKAEALAAMRLAGYNDLEASYSTSVAGHKQQLDAARAESEALRVDLAAIRSSLLPLACVPPGDHGEVEGVRMLQDQAEAAKQEAAALRARKVKLPPSRVPLTDPQGHGDPYANGYSWGLLDCAAAIRAAGVEVEG